MKINFGPITNVSTGKSKDVIVDSKMRLVPATDLVIGLFAIAAGIWELTRAAFRNGAKSYEEAEYETLDDLNLFM